MPRFSSVNPAEAVPSNNRRQLVNIRDLMTPSRLDIMINTFPNTVVIIFFIPPPRKACDHEILIDNPHPELVDHQDIGVSSRFIRPRYLFLIPMDHLVLISLVRIDRAIEELIQRPPDLQCGILRCSVREYLLHVRSPFKREPRASVECRVVSGRGCNLCNTVGG